MKTPRFRNCYALKPQHKMQHCGLTIRMDEFDPEQMKDCENKLSVHQQLPTFIGLFAQLRLILSVSVKGS